MLISHAFVAFVVVDNQQGSWNHLDTFLYICADVLSLWSLSAKNLLLPRSSCWLSASAKIHSTLADIQCLVVQRALEPGIVLDSDHGFLIIHQLKEYKGYLLEPSWVSLWSHNQPSPNSQVQVTWLKVPNPIVTSELLEEKADKAFYLLMRAAVQTRALWATSGLQAGIQLLNSVQCQQNQQ